jgi:hypothetical protein
MTTNPKRATVKKTGNPFLDNEQPGEVHVDKDGRPYETVAVFGPDLTVSELKKLRRAAFRLNATAELL